MRKVFWVIQTLEILPRLALKRDSIFMLGFVGKSSDSPEILRLRFASNMCFPRQHLSWILSKPPNSRIKENLYSRSVILPQTINMNIYNLHVVF